MKMEEYTLLLKKYAAFAFAGILGGVMAAFDVKQAQLKPLLIAACFGCAVSVFGISIVAHYLGIESVLTLISISYFLGLVSRPLVRKLATDPFFWLAIKKD